eukprot:389672_1
MSADEPNPRQLSITDIIPEAVIEYILLFIDSTDMKCINKTFKKSYESHMNKQLNQRKSIIENETLIPKVSFENNMNKTWIVHPTRKTLNEEEFANGYCGPINDLIDTINNKAQSGDKILVCNGRYSESTNNYIADQSNDNFKKSLQIIGVGDDVNITLLERELYIDSLFLFFKNVNLVIKDILQVEGNATFYLEDCNINIKLVGTISCCGTDAFFYAKNCVFSGNWDHNYRSPIEIGCGSSTIIGCKFINFRQSCIVIGLDNFFAKHMLKVGSENEFVIENVNIIANTFENNLGYPISELTVSCPQPHYSIKHNILKGRNGLSCHNIKTANKV